MGMWTCTVEDNGNGVGVAVTAEMKSFTVHRNCKRDGCRVLVKVASGYEYGDIGDGIHDDSNLIYADTGEKVAIDTADYWCISCAKDPGETLYELIATINRIVAERDAIDARIEANPVLLLMSGD